MPEKESFNEQVQLHNFTNSPPIQGATTLIPPSSAATALSMDRPPHQSYAGLQLPSAFMAYHSPHLQAAAAAAAVAADHQQRAAAQVAAVQAAHGDPSRYLWDPSASAAAAAAAAFHPSTSHG